MNGMKCLYCGSDVVLADSKVIYGKHFGKVYMCSKYPKCDSFVGAHTGTDKPLGTLANAELRELRKICHSLFDGWWKANKKTRKDAYAILRHTFNIPEQKCHIAMFDVKQCKKLISLFNDRHIQTIGSLNEEKK